MLSLAAALLLPSALANANLLPRQEGLGNVTSDDDFEAWLDTANATSRQEIMLPDIHNNSYPSRGSEIEYTAWLRVDDEKSTPNNPQGVQPLAHAGIQPLDSVISDNRTVTYDDSWRLCLGLIQFKDHGIPIDQPVNTNCSNVFEDDCLLLVTQSLRANSRCIEPEAWERVIKEGSCAGKPSDKWDSMYSGPVIPDGLTNFTLDAPGNLGNLDGSGEATTYDLLAQDVYMLIVGYGRASNDEDAVGGVNASVNQVNPTLVCMRADDFAEGSKDLQDIEDVGVGLSAPLSWSLLMGAATAWATAALL